MKILSLLLWASVAVNGFMPLSTRRAAPWGLSHLQSSTSSLDSSSSTKTVTADDLSSYSHDSMAAVRAPLKFIGPYPTLALRFPHLATEAQRARNVSGVSLDFVLDTAANINTIQQQVARELSLEIVGSALPGVTAAGAMQGGETYMLGDSQLDGLGEAGNFTFMTELTASALPVASPAAAGLLSFAFMYTFDGVGFQWAANEDGPPSVTFYEKVPKPALANMQRVAIQPIPVTQLPSVTVRVNGCEIPALLDTGSPVTVFNGAAAKQAGIVTTKHDGDASRNPLAKMANRLQQAQAMARGDVLQVMGNHGLVNLLKSASPVSVSLPTTTRDSVEFQHATSMPGTYLA